jgi:hypothetical protein
VVGVRGRSFGPRLRRAEGIRRCEAVSLVAQVLVNANMTGSKSTSDDRLFFHRSLWREVGWCRRTSKCFHEGINRGHLQRTVVLPLGIALAVKLIPPEIMAEHRAAAETTAAKPTSPYRGGVFAHVISYRDAGYSQLRRLAGG